MPSPTERTLEARLTRASPAASLMALAVEAKMKAPPLPLRVVLGGLADEVRGPSHEQVDGDVEEHLGLTGGPAAQHGEGLLADRGVVGGGVVAGGAGDERGHEECA